MSFRHHAAAAAVTILASIYVIDGDTVRVDGKRYRLETCDTPETRYAQCKYERDLGRAAKRRLEELIQSGRPDLQPTGRSCAWGRECADLFVDGVNVCDLLIEERLAVPYRRGERRKAWCN